MGTGFRFISMIVLASSILIIACCAQSSSSFQSVGEDFGRTWLNNFNAQNPEPVQQSSGNSLWSWGGTPRGRAVINGQLVTDPYYYWRSLNYSSGWLGQVYTDNATGNPVFAYIDPYTGNPDYFYMDPKTGSPVYINTGLAPGLTSSVPTNYLPPGLAATGDYPWLGLPEDFGNGDSSVYGGGTSVYGSAYGSGYDSGGMGMV